MSEAPSERPARHYHPLWGLVGARLREFIREPEAIFWVYVFPLCLMVALGVAFRNRPVETLRIAVVSGPQGSELAAALSADSRFRVQVQPADEARLYLRTGRADLVIEARPGSHAGLEYVYDPTRPESVLARHAADDRLQRAAGREDRLAALDRPATEPGGRYIDFLVPGLIGMGLMGGGLWGVGYAIVDMRIRKLLKRYVATPMPRSHFLASVILSRLVFTIPETLLLLVCARVLFEVACYGSYLVLLGLIVLGSLQFSGIGLLVASRARTIEAVSGLMNAVMLPIYIGSGIFFSTERFPETVQPALLVLPLTPLLNAMRKVMLEGIGLLGVLPEMAVVTLWAAATFLLALRWFRWT